jgi:hypothetical protein
MKKLFSTIFVICFLLSGNAYAAESIKDKLVFTDQITSNFLKNKSVTDLVKLGFGYRTERVTTT